MPQTEIGQKLSLSLFARKQGETKKAEPCRLLPCFWTHVGAQVALQRCPILRTGAIIIQPGSPLKYHSGHFTCLKVDFLFRDSVDILFRY